MKNKIEYILKHNLFIQTLYRYIMSSFFRFIGLFVRTNNKLVLMNGHGYKYNDSPRAIFQKMIELGLVNDYEIVWALKEPDKFDIPYCKKIKMDTFKYFITALKAKYWISCVNIERGLKFKKRNTVFLNTWHGSCINLCGKAVSKRNDFHNKHVDYFCISGEYERYFTIRDYDVLPKAILPSGYPRNDELYHVDNDNILMIKKQLNIPMNKKVILYAPTWRDSNDGGTSYKLAPPIDWKKWEEKMGNDYVVLLRTHPYTTKLMNVDFNDFVRNCTDYPNINHLYLVADYCISDYSSVLLDYSILEKPMFCFGYDFEEYNRIRGFYFDMESVIPNGVIRDEQTLMKMILEADYNELCLKTKKFKNEHMEYGGNASIICINKVFNTNYK